MKTKQGFVQIPLLVGVVLALFFTGGIGYYSIQKKTEKTLLKTDSQNSEVFKVPGDLVNNIPDTSSEVNKHTQFSKPAVLDKTKPDVAVGNIFLDHVEAQHANIPKNSQILLIEKNTGKNFHGGVYAQSLIGGTEAMREQYYTNVSFKECSPAGNYFFRIVKKGTTEVIAESKTFYYPGSRYFSDCKIASPSGLEKELSGKGIVIGHSPTTSEYPLSISGYVKQGIDAVAIKITNSNGVAVVDSNVKVRESNFTTLPPTVPIKGRVDDEIKRPNYSEWVYTSSKKLPVGVYNISASSGNINVNKKLEIGPPLPTCIITTNKPVNKWGEVVYKQGEEIVLSWTSKNADYAVFDRAESDSFHFSFPGEKLLANGSFTIKSRIYPGVGDVVPASLRVYNSTGEGYCRSLISVH